MSSTPDDEPVSGRIRDAATVGVDDVVTIITEVVVISAIVGIDIGGWADVLQDGAGEVVPSKRPAIPDGWSEECRVGGRGENSSGIPGKNLDVVGGCGYKQGEGHGM